MKQRQKQNVPKIIVTCYEKKLQKIKPAIFRHKCEIKDLDDKLYV